MNKPFVTINTDEEKKTITVNWRNCDPVTVPMDGCGHENRSPLSFQGTPVPLCGKCKAMVLGR